MIVQPDYGEEPALLVAPRKCLAIPPARKAPNYTIRCPFRSIYHTYEELVVEYGKIQIGMY